VLSFNLNQFDSLLSTLSAPATMNDTMRYSLCIFGFISAFLILVFILEMQIKQQDRRIQAMKDSMLRKVDRKIVLDMLRKHLDASKERAYNDAEDDE
jgi:hypothetical protein